MRVSVQCPHCAAKFTVREEFAGKCVHCKKCQQPVDVPDDGLSESEYRGEPLTRTGLSSTTIATSRSNPRRKRDGDENIGKTLGIGLGAGVAAIVGLVILGALMSGGGTSPPQFTPPAPIDSTSRMAPMAAVPTPVPVATIATPSTNATSNAQSNAVSPVADEKPETTSSATSTTRSSETVTSSDKKAPYDLPDLIAEVEPSVVRIDVETKTGGGTGSGFVVDEAGTVVTNYHVIAGATAASVKFVDGTEAKVLGVRHTLPKKDIAIIKIDVPKDKLHPIALAKAFPKKGASVVAFGAPAGLSFSATEGIVSAVRTSEEIRDEIGLNHEGTWIQTSSPTSGGMSGGPLTDRFGMVVGMNTWGLVKGQNLNFTISSVDIQQAVKAAPEVIVALSPTTFKEYDANAARNEANEEIGTTKGTKLLSQIKEIFLLNLTPKATLAFDPTGAIWDKVARRSEVIVDRCKIDLSFGKPADDAAVMFVIFKMKPTRKGTPGTMELMVEAKLICLDPAAKRSKSPYCVVWKDDENIGTISLEALAGGNFPRAADEKLAKFFFGLQTAYLKAVKEAAKPAEAEKGKDDDSTKSKDKETENPFTPKK